MRLIVSATAVSCIAARTATCRACGTPLHGQRVFTHTFTPGQQEAAVAVLLERVRQWRGEAVCCGRCPERTAAGAGCVA